MYNDLFSLKDMNYDFNLNHSEYYELKEQLLEALMSFSRNKVSLNEYLHIFDNQVIDLINGDISIFLNSSINESTPKPLNSFNIGLDSIS